MMLQQSGVLPTGTHSLGQLFGHVAVMGGGGGGGGGRGGDGGGGGWRR